MQLQRVGASMLPESRKDVPSPNVASRSHGVVRNVDPGPIEVLFLHAPLDVSERVVGQLLRNRLEETFARSTRPTSKYAAPHPPLGVRPHVLVYRSDCKSWLSPASHGSRPSLL